MSYMNELTDQTYAWATEMYCHIKQLRKDYKLDFDEAVKIMELTLGNMSVSIEWKNFLLNNDKVEG